MIDNILYPFELKFFFSLLVFTAAFIFQYFIPGWILLKNTKLTGGLKKVLSPIVGLAVSTIISYLCSLLKINFFIYVYLLFTNLFFFKKGEYKKIKLFNSLRNFNLAGFFLIAAGSVNQLIAVFGSGFRNLKGINYYWINAHDGLFHLSLTKSLTKSFPPIQPGAWPLRVTNYHFFSNLAMADMSSIWKLSINHLYFHFFPIFLSIFMGLIIYKLVKYWTNSSLAANLALFFHYFAGDMSFVTSFILHKKFIFASDSIDNGAIQFINMPQAFAKIIFFTGLTLLSNFIRTKNRRSGLLSILCFSSLVGFKVYFGIFAAIGLSILFAFKLIEEFIKNKNIKKLIAALFNNKTLLNFWLKLLLFYILLSAIFFFPTNKSSGGLFWAPLDWVKLYFSANKMDWNDWLLRMQVYEAANNIKSIVFWNLLAITLFLISIFGVRLLGLLLIFQDKSCLNKEEFVFLYFPSLIFIFLGMNTLQVSGGHNVFNFFVVALINLSILASLSMSIFLKKANFLNKILALSIIVIFTIPRNIKTNLYFLNQYLDGRDKVLISNQELEAFEFIKTKTPKEALIQPDLNNELSNETPYLFFFTDRYSYFSGEGILRSHNQPIDQKKENVSIYLDKFNSDGKKQNISCPHFDYLYLLNEKPMLHNHDDEERLIFSNKMVKIYKLN